MVSQTMVGSKKVEVEDFQDISNDKGNMVF